MKDNDLSFWEIQFGMALCALAGLVWGGIIYLIQLWAGGPAWLPYVVGLVVFILVVAIVGFNQKFGHHD